MRTKVSIVGLCFVVVVALAAFMEVPNAVQALRGLAKGDIPDENVSEPGGEAEEPFLELVWVFNTSAVFTGKSFGAGNMGCFTVFDIDSDGRNEILFGTRRGNSKRIWCLEQSQQEGTAPVLDWIFPPIDGDGLPGDPTSKVSIVDLEGDGVYELAFGGRGGKLFILRGDSSVVWVWDDPDGSANHGAPQALDVDGDGFVEFFLANSAYYVYRINHLGQTVWRVQRDHHTYATHPTVCDLEGDGLFEVVYAEYHGKAVCLDAGTGEERWVLDAHLDPGAIVMDVNRDGELEIITWAEDYYPHEPSGGVYCISRWGSLLWHLPAMGNARMCQAVGDVDEDGSVEIVLSTSCGIYCVDMGGTTPKLDWQINVTKWWEEGLLPAPALADHWGSYQLIVDMDGDGCMEVLLEVPYPVIVDGATGALEAYYYNEHMAVGRRPENGGWWGDFDGDGVSEWICELNGNSHRETMVYCLTMNGTFPADAYWPEYYHSSLPWPGQEAADWLRMKSPNSNGLYFPLPEALCWLAGAVLAILTKANIE